MASEPIVKPIQDDYSSRPMLLTHARPRGSITEAKLISALFMTPSMHNESSTIEQTYL
jgi:hypothetical protein